MQNQQESLYPFIHPLARLLAQSLTQATRPEPDQCFAFSLRPSLRSFVRLRSDRDSTVTAILAQQHANMQRSSFCSLAKPLPFPSASRHPPSRLRVPTKSNGVSIMMRMIMMPTRLPACIPRARARACIPPHSLHACSTLAHASTGLSLSLQWQMDVS